MLRLFCLLWLVLLTGCHRTAEPVVIVGNSWLGTASIISAAAVDAKLLPPSFKPVMLVSDVSVTRMLNNDAAAGAFVSLANALGLNSMSHGSYCVALVMDYSHGADAILARGDWRHDESSQLRVGLEDSTLARYVLSRWMTTHNIVPERVRTEVMLPTEHVTAWQQRNVDLFVTYQPFVERLEQLGARVLYDSEHHTLPVTNVFIVNKRHWPEIAPLVTQFRERSWPRINEMRENRPESFWRALQALTELDQAELRSALDEINFVTAADQDEALNELVHQTAPALAKELQRADIYKNIPELQRCDVLGWED